MLPDLIPAQVTLYSNQPVLARGLACVLSQAAELSFAGVCLGMEERVARTAPDILLLDVTPEVTFDLLTELRHTLPRCSLVLWTGEIGTELAFQALGLGVRGILRKTASPESLIECLLKVRSGELWYDKELADSFFSARRVVLTQRESQLVSLIASGLKNKEIATALQISEGTVKVYLGRLFHKVGVKDRFELALFGLKNLTSGTGRMVPYQGGPDAARAPGLRSLVLSKSAPASDRC